VGVFSRRKRCPICQARNEVALDGGAAGEGDAAIFLVWLKAKCRTCDYDFSFGWLSLLLSGAGLLPGVMLLLNIPEEYCGVCGVMIVIYFTLGFVVYMSILHTNMFDRLLDRLIIRKAKKLVRKGKTESWTGSFLNVGMRERVKRMIEED
jgi:hypothetical protein